MFDYFFDSYSDESIDGCFDILESPVILRMFFTEHQKYRFFIFKIHIQLSDFLFNSRVSDQWHVARMRSCYNRLSLYHSFAFSHRKHFRYIAHRIILSPSARLTLSYGHFSFNFIISGTFRLKTLSSFD